MMAAPEKMQALGELRRDEPMSRHTSWRAGGKAELFFIPASVEDLQAFLRELDAETPIFWLGVGSNLLVRDGGLRGVVIHARSSHVNAFAGVLVRRSSSPAFPARLAAR
jgi:UDP-N-acetylenolpyruvoylglucosamine reductase